MKSGNAALILGSLLAVGLMALLFGGCTSGDTKLSQVERGKYLVTAGGCGDCHSPKIFTKAGPAPDPTKLLSGYPADAKLPEMPKGVVGPSQWGALTTNDMTAWAGPWGVSFAYNLTPHPATGIGYWTEALFIQSIRTGKFMGSSRDMMPPMPWRAMANLTDEDLKAILAYLKTLPPIDNAIPAPRPPSPE